MLIFVEKRTAFAADVGYGDDAFFSSLENMLSRTLERFQHSPPMSRAAPGKSSSRGLIAC